MADHRIDEDGDVTRVRDANGNTTTVVERRGSRATPLLLIALLIAVGAVAYFMFAANERASTRDNAIANAAGAVGDAAEDVGDAVRRRPAE